MRSSLVWILLAAASAAVALPQASGAVERSATPACDETTGDCGLFMDKYKRGKERRQSSFCAAIIIAYHNCLINEGHPFFCDEYDSACAVCNCGD